MRVKQGVDISKLNQKIRQACSILDFCYWLHGAELVITSTYDGKHKKGSKHYTNDAIDARIDDLDGEWDGKITTVCVSVAKAIIVLAKRILGNDFDIILESDHIHMEYDPK